MVIKLIVGFPLGSIYRLTRANLGLNQVDSVLVAIEDARLQRSTPGPR